MPSHREAGYLAKSPSHKVFCATLRTRRLAEKLTTPDVAELIGCYYETIYSWENGASTPSLHFFEKLVEVFGELPRPPINAVAPRGKPNRGPGRAVYSHARR